MTRNLEVLDTFVAGLPRVSLGIFPTPLVPLERLSRHLGIDLWMKRDECTGLALGGNKTRKMEFILADAIKHGHDTVVTTGPLTSNHTMMTAMAGRRLGLQVHCVIGGESPNQPFGNLLLLEYLGATVHYTPLDFSKPESTALAQYKVRCHEVVEETGGYWIPGGGTMPQAEPAYMLAVSEIAHQCDERFDFDDVVLAIGTGSTTTGLLLGLALGGFDCHVNAVATADRHSIENIFKRRSPAEQFVKASAALGIDLTAENVPPYDVRFGFAEEGYSIPSVGGDQAIRLLAREEGYLLDPIYTAKAFHGLLTMVDDGRIKSGTRVLFLHTGGLSMTPITERRYEP